MSDTYFWKQVEVVTENRIDELKQIIANKSIPGMRLRWTQGLLEINQEWNAKAKAELYDYEQVKKYLEHKAAMKQTTFRGNADED